MGKIILLPLKFILFFLISAGVFLTFSLIYYWGQWFSPAIDIKNSLIIFLPLSAFNIILPSVSSGLLFTFFSYRRSKINPVAVLLAAAAAFAIIFFSLRLASEMESNTDSAAFQPFNERKLQITDSSIIYTDEISEENPEKIEGVIVRSTDEVPGFRYYLEAELITGKPPVLRIDDDRRINISPRNPVFNDIFKPEGVLAGYLNDMNYMNTSFRTALGKEDLQYLFLTSAFTVFLMSCFLLRGSTVWPLLDFIMILGLHRLGYYLYSLFSKESAFISDTLFGGRQLDNIPLFTICGFSLVILLCGLLLRLTSGRKTA